MDVKIPFEIYFCTTEKHKNEKRVCRICDAVLLLSMYDHPRPSLLCVSSTDVHSGCLCMNVKTTCCFYSLLLVHSCDAFCCLCMDSLWFFDDTFVISSKILFFQVMNEKNSAFYCCVRCFISWTTLTHFCCLFAQEMNQAFLVTLVGFNSLVLSASRVWILPVLDMLCFVGRKFNIMTRANYVLPYLSQKSHCESLHHFTIPSNIHNNLPKTREIVPDEPQESGAPETVALMSVAQNTRQTASCLFTAMISTVIWMYRFFFFLSTDNLKLACWMSRLCASDFVRTCVA